MGYVAIGAGCFHATAVAVVNGTHVFLIDVIFHLMATDTEFFGIRHFHPGIKTAPEDNATDKTNQQ